MDFESGNADKPSHQKKVTIREGLFNFIVDHPIISLFAMFYGAAFLISIPFKMIDTFEKKKESDSLNEIFLRAYKISENGGQERDLIWLGTWVKNDKTLSASDASETLKEICQKSSYCGSFQLNWYNPLTFTLYGLEDNEHLIPTILDNGLDDILALTIKDFYTNGSNLSWSRENKIDYRQLKKDYDYLIATQGHDAAEAMLRHSITTDKIFHFGLAEIPHVLKVANRIFQNSEQPKYSWLESLNIDPDGKYTEQLLQIEAYESIAPVMSKIVEDIHLEEQFAMEKYMRQTALELQEENAHEKKENIEWNPEEIGRKLGSKVSDITDKFQERAKPIGEFLQGFSDGLNDNKPEMSNDD